MTEPREARSPECRRSLGRAPLGIVAVLGCCAVHALVVGGIAATWLLWLGFPAVLVVVGVTMLLWWRRHTRAGRP